MKVILLGATGMVGQGVLQECLADPGVEVILSVGRSRSGIQNPKLKELLVRDFSEFPVVGSVLTGFEACLFCLGTTSIGKSEAEYRAITYDLTLSVAETLAKTNPEMTFVYVSGVGTDGSGKSKTMWVRIKGATENALLALPFKAAYMFRPGYIRPMDGIRPRTRWIGVMYKLTNPLYPLVHALFPKSVMTTASLGKAMIKVAREGYPKRTLEPADINTLSPG